MLPIRNEDIRIIARLHFSGIYKIICSADLKMGLHEENIFDCDFTVKYTG